MSQNPHPALEPDAPATHASVYLVRPLASDAERDEAAALVEDRRSWLTRRGLPLPARLDTPALYRDAQSAAVGLFEDEDLLSCLILDPRPDLRRWGTNGAGPSLLLREVHTLPGRPDNAIRLLTLWAADYAARLNLPCVRAEAPARYPLNVDPITRVLDRLRHMGWEIRGTGPGADGDQAALLELRSQLHPRLTPLVGCMVPLALSGSSTDSPASKGATQR
ncbi:hypothetical protein V1J52_21155 [Streptomyces sp. TRM 70351]|uniref:hypothetical protein n=1 Tax=Streptomyces sp. TRM 70351 TaxID=3116552 RepID=UPI002E7B2781|nr:hypothetical protein [Streptomyces sp. TRM 70351]MEE1930667.1 hypothetical protein [Streptomyces sp. TRM 70351]